MNLFADNAKMLRAIKRHLDSMELQRDIDKIYGIQHRNCNLMLRNAI